MSECRIDELGDKRWFFNDRLHREDGPAVEWANGSKSWWMHGKRHRENGPAIERTDGYKAWWVNHISHREDGPAIEHADGTKIWYLNGKKIECSSNEEFFRIVKMKAFW